MNPYLEFFPTLLMIRKLPDGPERRRLQRSIDFNAETTLNLETRESKPGSELYPLRHTKHPLLKQCVRLLSSTLVISVIYDLFSRTSMTQEQLHRMYWIDGMLLALLAALLVIILIGQHQRKKWLKSCSDAAYAKLDITSSEKLEKLCQLYTFTNERPGASCGCLSCMYLFAVPKSFPFDKQEVKCPRCGGYRIVYDSPKAPLTPESLAELHDFVSKE